MTKTEFAPQPITRLDVLSLIHAQCHRVYLSAINREEIDTKYMAEIEDALRRLAATTQAVPVGEFAGYVDGIVPVVDWVKGNMPKVGDKLYLAATTQASTAQAEPVAWISVDERLPECSKKAGSLGVEVIVYPRPEKGESTAFFGCRLTDDPDFYKYGARVGGVTHWIPLPPEPVIRSAGDTGSGE